MKKTVFALIAAMLFLGGCAMRQHPIMQVNNAPIHANGGEDAVAAKIKTALSNRGWQVIAEEPGKITAQFVKVNPSVGQHSVTILIPYDADSYSIDFVTSENMMYDADKHVIHRNYNRWVANLEKDLAESN